MIKTCSIRPDMARGVAMKCADLVVVGLASAPEVSLDDVLRRVEERSAQMWVVFDNGRPVSVSFTEIVSDGGVRFVAVFGLSGRSVWRWARLFADTIVAFAVSEGCDAVRFFGRRSWARLVPGCRNIGCEDGQAMFERPAR